MPAEDSLDKPLALIVMPLAEQRGGAELALLQLIGSKTDWRWHVVFLEDGPMVAQCVALNIAATVIDAGRVRQPHKMISAVWKIARLAKQTHARIVLGWMAKAHVYGGLAALIARLPAGWFQHGSPTPGSWIDGFANRIRAVGALACSQFSADAQLRVTPELAVRVVHPAADLIRFNPDVVGSPSECRARLGLSNDGPIIGIFGRLQSWKGMHVLIDSLPTVLLEHPQARALVVGGAWQPEANYEQQLKQRVEQLNLNLHVIFTGQQSNIPEWMQACDVIVHASNNEPFGMVVVEAMAMAKPVVAGAGGGPREAIADGVTGLLSPFGDVAALSKAILRYLNDPAFARTVGLAARQRAQDFSIDRFANGVSRALWDWIYSDASGMQNQAPMPDPLNKTIAPTETIHVR